MAVESELPAREHRHGLDNDDEGEEAPEHVWQSREVRWSAASGLLLAVGYVAHWAGAADGGPPVRLRRVAVGAAGRDESGQDDHRDH